MTDSANLDLVRSVYADWERADLFTWVELAHPEIEFVVADGADPVSSKGLGALSEVVRDRQSAWEDYQLVVEKYLELDNERILVLFKRTGRGKASGVDLGQVWTEGASLLHVRDGKVTRFVSYWDRDRAFADLGLIPDIGT